ncbi:MAG: hypothetical protein BWY15_01829 [Firmicutes bacterium ADurb.Bin193]|nr:MAG: hypothetical protein BWY15_01829 [Firmicutes bacterium ADurb.Bin193]
MKKKVLFLIAVLMAASVSASATPLEEAVYKTVVSLSVEMAVDFNVLRLYKDWSFVDKQYRPAMAGALFARLLCPEGDMLNPKSEDLTPLIKGLERFGFKDTAFEVVSVKGGADMNISDDTLFLIDNEIVPDYKPVEGESYYALVNRGGKIFALWKQNGALQDCIFKGSLYLQEGDTLILTNTKKLVNGLWEDVSENKYITVRLEGGRVKKDGREMEADEVNANHLDSDIYILGSLSENEINAKYASPVF